MFNVLLGIVYMFYYFLINRFPNSKNKRTFWFLITIIMVLFVGARSKYYGGDTYNYHEIFYNMGNYSWTKLFADFFDGQFHLEIGYAILNKLVYSLCPYGEVMIFVGAILCLVPLMLFVSKIDQTPLLSLTFILCSGTFIYTFNIVRQSIAVAFLVTCWLSLVDKKYFKAIVFMILAISFHYSAMIMVILFLIPVLSKSKITIIVLVTILAAIKMNVPFALGMMIKYFPKYEGYVNLQGTDTSVNRIVILWVVYLMLSFVLLVLVSFENLNFKDRCNIYCGIISTICYIFFTSIGLNFYLVDRVGIYFIPFIVYVLLYIRDLVVPRLNFGGTVLNSCSKNIYSYMLILLFILYYIVATKSIHYIPFWSLKG